MKTFKILLALGTLGAALALAGCGGDDNGTTSGDSGSPQDSYARARVSSVWTVYG